MIMDQLPVEVAIGAFIAGVAPLLGNEDPDEEAANRDVEGRRRRRRLMPIHANANGFINLDDKSFKEHFRLSRTLFEILLLSVGNFLTEHGRIQRLRTPLHLSLMMTLWILGTQDSFRSVAANFGIPSRGTVHYHFITMIEALRDMAPLFIQWPDMFERDNTKAFFERRFGYPGVVGCIDGTHIYISAPLLQAPRYINRFQKYSVLLQAVCDHKLIFRDIYVGQPGSVHDSRMFSRSPLSHNLLHNPDMLSEDEHILGDGAYTLTDKVITPYRNMGNLNMRRRNHNYKHASVRSSIERAFMLDKNLWRRQKLMLAYSLEYVLDIVVSCCVLHNFRLLDGVPYVDRVQNGACLVQRIIPNEAAAVQEEGNEDENNEDDNNEEIVDDPDEPPIVPGEEPALRRAKVAGRAKRDFIAELLHPDEEDLP